MVLENAYFIREARQVGRKQFGPLARVLLLLWLGLLVSLFLVEGWPRTIEPLRLRQVLSLMLLLVSHTFACTVTGWRMGSRVFIDEYQQRTLETLQIVSLSPWRWLPQKLLFPLYGLLLVWLAALPAYVALVIRGHFMPPEVQPAALIALCAGLLGLASAIILSPSERPDLRSSMRGLAQSGSSALSAAVLVPGGIALVLLTMSLSWLIQRAGANFFASRRYYEMRLPVEVELGALLAIYLLAALAGAFATADPISEPARRLAAAARLVLVVVGYYHLVGCVWPALVWYYRIPAMLGLPVAALVWRRLSGRKAQRSEDPLAVREVEWLARRWDDPMFIRDLRVTLRVAGLRRQLGMMFVQQLIAPVALALLWTHVQAPGTGPATAFPWREFVWFIAVIIAVLAPIYVMGVLGALGTRAQFHWKAERRFETLSQLLGMPVSSEELVRGRTLASALVGTVAVVPTLFLAAVGAAVVATSQPELLLPYLGALLYLASLGVFIAAVAACADQSSWMQTLGGLVFVAEIMLVLGPGMMLLVPRMGRVEPFAAVVALLGALLLNGALTWLFYRRSITWLEGQRKRQNQ